MTPAIVNSSDCLLMVHMSQSAWGIRSLSSCCGPIQRDGNAVKKGMVSSQHG